MRICHAAGVDGISQQSFRSAKKDDDDSSAQELHMGFCDHFSLAVCVCDTISSDLVSIPAQLLDVLQELVGAHVGCVQAGLMLAGHLRGPGRGFLTPGFICTYREQYVQMCQQGLADCTI